MNISPLLLDVQARQALSSWPWIPQIEDERGLPRWLLIAVASRETNCINEPGDAGPRPTDPPSWLGKPYHAWSPWQIDMNSGGSPALLTNPRQAAEIAAGMLVAHHLTFGDWKVACSAYNAGARGAAQGLAHGDSDLYTTGHDYGADVMARMQALQSLLPREEPLMDRAGLISFLANAICARDASADELTKLSAPGVSDRAVVVYFEDSDDGTAIKLSRRAAAGLK